MAMNDEEFGALVREATYMNEVATWLTISVERDVDGTPHARAVLSAHFEVDPADLAGSLIREIHRRLEEFEAELDE